MKGRRPYQAWLKADKRHLDLGVTLDPEPLTDGRSEDAHLAVCQKFFLVSREELEQVIKMLAEAA